MTSRHSVVSDTVDMEKCVNCWEALRASQTTAWSARTSATVKKLADWVISSQAPQECGEGSTTRAWSPDRTVKPHERAPRKGRYSLASWETVRSAIKCRAITKRPYTGKLDDLSEHPIREIIHKVLKHDAKKAFDIDAHAEFDKTQLKAVAAATGTSTNAITLTTNGTATLTNNVAFGKGHVKAIVDEMKERNIPCNWGLAA